MGFSLGIRGAENVSYSYIESIENELRNVGKVSEVGYYAMQKDATTEKWKDSVKECGYKPILMMGERTKNKKRIVILAPKNTSKKLKKASSEVRMKKTERSGEC